MNNNKKCTDIDFPWSQLPLKSVTKEQELQKPKKKKLTKEDYQEIQILKPKKKTNSSSSLTKTMKPITKNSSKNTTISISLPKTVQIQSHQIIKFKYKFDKVINRKRNNDLKYRDGFINYWSWIRHGCVTTIN